MAETAIGRFDWADPFALDAQLSDEERLVRDTAAAYAQEKLQPRVTPAFLDEDFADANALDRRDRHYKKLRTPVFTSS